MRIPKAFELPEGEVFVEKRGGGLFISPLRDRWDLFFSVPGAAYPFAAAELRDNRPPRDVQWTNKGIVTATKPARKGKKAK